MLWDIKDAQWKSLVKPVPTDLASVDLAKPRLVVQLFEKGKTNPLILKAGWQLVKKTEVAKKEPDKKEVSTKKPAETKETSSKPAAVKSAAAGESKASETIYAIAQPQEEKDAVMVLDGAFLSHLQDALKQLTETE
jgi:hypothetical protein